ncbi:ABC transporter substrate-binding protein [Saccharococcus caldoxylosilyticus]|uniref:ABC transporter substrate-binding protein n=1 Tax=Saccharococcus caldoxylosilyticus TaxID=81408 RepID=UPI001FD1961D|nr:ABC transporter substrate-binding protein [Parageobacillus caldoxylosilyticus]
MMGLWKRVGGIAAATILGTSLVLMGCSSKTSENTSSTSSSGKQEITFWTPFSGADGPFMKKIVDAYNEQSDKYNVKFQIIPSGEYYKQVDLALSTGKKRPDLMIMHVDQIPTYQKKGQLQPVDDIAAKAGIKKEDFVEAPVKYSTIDGKWYGIPLDIHPLILYYNKDLFKAAGIDHPPTNRQEFIEAAKKLTDKSKGQWGYVVPTLWPQQFIFPTIVGQNGAKLADEQGKPRFNSPEAVEALTFLKDLIYKYKVSPKKVAQDGEVTLFLQGKNAMQLNGPWMKDQFDKAKINYGVAPVPQLGTKQQAVQAGSHNFVIPKDVKDPKVLEGIGDFLKYVAAHSIDWAQSGQAVASKQVLASDAFKQLTKQQTIVAKEFDYAQFNPPVINWGAMTTDLYKEINLVLLGQKDPQKALDEAQEKALQVK